LRDKTPKFDKFTQGLDQLVMKVSLDKEISKKQMKKVMGREGESEGQLVCKNGGVENFQLVKDRSPIYHQVSLNLIM
jgi:hypothetical protein